MTAMPPPAAPRRFLGWDTVVGGASIQLLHSALFFQSFGLFVVAWASEFGWSLTAISTGYALVTLQSGLIGPVHGRLLERVGVRRVVFAGMLLLAGALAFLSTVTTLAGYYAGMVALGLGLSISGFLSITTAIVPWFVRRRSTALALMSLGISAGGLLVPLVAAVSLASGWRATLQLAALLTLAAAGPLTILMRRPPEAYGQVPDGRRPPRIRAPSPPARHTAPHDHTLREALRTRAFWLLGVGHGIAVLVVSAVSVHLIPHLADSAGFSLQRAAGVVALVTVMSAVGQAVGGPLGDRFDKRALATLAMLAHAAGLAALAAAGAPAGAAGTPAGAAGAPAGGDAAIVVFAVLHGLGWGLRGPLMTSLRADYFGIRHFGSIMGVSVTVIMVGQLIGPILVATMADASGDLRSAFALVAALAAAASIAFWWATPPARTGRG